MRRRIRNSAGKRQGKPFLFFVSSFFMFLFFNLALDALGSIVSEIEINGLSSIKKEELLYLLDIRVDGHIDHDKVREGIKRAFLKGIFEDITVEATDGEQVKVTITVMERDFINKILIEGDYDLSKKFIRNNFSLREGQVLRQDLIEPAIKKLQQDIVRRGFPHVSIEAKTERIKKPYRANLHLWVYTGEPEMIKEIIISIGTDDTKGLMKLSDGDIYDQAELENDVERIRTYYRKNGYFRPRVGPHTFTGGVLNIPVYPGKRLIVSTEGNSVFSAKTLYKEMPFFEAENFNDDLVEESVSKILSLYHAKGYPFAQVAPVITSKDDVINLSLFIFEGKKVKVGSINFSGVSLLEDNLKDVMSLKKGGLYNPDLIDTDRETIIELYSALGYIEAVIEKFETIYNDRSEKMEINIKVLEGSKTEIGKITITGTSRIPDEEITRTIKIKPGDPYNEVDITEARSRVIQLYNARGFLDVIVFVKRDFENHRVFLTFQIHEGDSTIFGKSIVSGNSTTRYEVVKRELRHREGSAFDYPLLQRERQDIYKTGLFTDVDIEVLDRYDHKRDALIKLREGNAGAVEFGFGYADYEHFRGFFDLSYSNLWGMNRQASFRLELSSIEKRSILQYLEPWFLDRQMPFRIFLLYEDRKEVNIDTRDTLYRVNRYAAIAGIEKKLSDNLKAELYHEFSLTNTFDVQPDVDLSKEDTGTLAISALKPGIIYDTRDNPFDPRKGILSAISLKATSPLLLSETNFLKLLFQESIYQQLSKRFVFALSLRGGLAWGYDDTEELPIVERFFLGGRTTVRGYEQDMLGPIGDDGNPTGGNAFFCGNAELRSYFGKGLGIVAFLDAGNVWQKVGDIDLGSIKYTTGLGLRYNTPIGPIRVDYGHKLEREKGESAGELHFAIGHAF